MKQMKHWQDPVNALLGAWLILSPWALGFQSEQTALVNAVIVGILLAAAALGATLAPRAWEEWTEVALGLWMAVSPWVLGFAAMEVARLNAVVTGLIVAALALWVLFTDKDYATWQGDRPAV
jgi:ABC-type uncharacterized transport system permease subunit